MPSFLPHKPPRNNLVEGSAIRPQSQLQFSGGLLDSCQLFFVGCILHLMPSETVGDQHEVRVCVWIAHHRYWRTVESDVRTRVTDLCIRVVVRPCPRCKTLSKGMVRQENWRLNPKQTEQSSWLLFLKYPDALEWDKATEAEMEGKK